MDPNRLSPTNPDPNYFDNPFWERYENVQNDQRDRVFGNITMKYKINDVFSLMGRALSDFYIDRREERIAVGGVRESSYSETTRQLPETNLDAYLNFADDLSDDLNLTGFVGVNQRIRNYKRLNAYTLGGLNTPGLYTVNNGADGYEVGTSPAEEDQLRARQRQLRLPAQVLRGPDRPQRLELRT